jgi:plastocyanin
VTMLRAGRSVLLLSALCLMCWGCIAIAAPAGRTSRHRPHRTAPVCHRARHRRCQLTRAEKSRRKHKTHTTSKPVNPSSSGPSSSTPWSTVPSSAGPGSSPTTSNSGQSPEAPVDKDPPTKSPAAPAPEATPRVEVTAEDTEAFRFVLSRPTVPAGKVIIEFVNHGQDEHNLNAVEETEGSVAGSLPNTPSNGHLSLTVDLRPGDYTLFCSLPGHEAKGMKATLVVE